MMPVSGAGVGVTDGDAVGAALGEAVGRRGRGRGRGGRRLGRGRRRRRRSASASPSAAGVGVGAGVGVAVGSSVGAADSLGSGSVLGARGRRGGRDERHRDRDVGHEGAVGDRGHAVAALPGRLAVHDARLDDVGGRGVDDARVDLDGERDRVGGGRDDLARDRACRCSR